MKQVIPTIGFPKCWSLQKVNIWNKRNKKCSVFEKGARVHYIGKYIFGLSVLSHEGVDHRSTGRS